MENPSVNEVMVNYSITKQDPEGKELLELLHGVNVNESGTKKVTATSVVIELIVKRAK